MTRILTLVRHAKSDWGNPELRDFDRPLNARGERDASRMAGRLKAAGHRPEVMVSSPANRAWRTAQVFAGILEVPDHAQHREDAIYDAPPGRLLDVIGKFRPDWQDAMLFGHNPGISQVARGLVGDTIDELPTCATVRLALDGDWDELVGRSHRLLAYDWPKRVQD